MISRVTIFMCLLCGGILLLVAGLLLTRLNWRSDIEPFGRRHRFFQIALHPQDYCTDRRLREIRVLNALGALLLCGALAVVTYDIVLSSSRG
jgi:hypothetical protein